MPDGWCSRPGSAADQHLARHQLADLFLDTLPYNAHTTCSDALWAGVPVVTCYGNAFPGRVAASLLKAIDLPELVTTRRRTMRTWRWNWPAIRRCSRQHARNWRATG